MTEPTTTSTNRTSAIVTVATVTGRTLVRSRALLVVLVLLLGVWAGGLAVRFLVPNPHVAAETVNDLVVSLAMPVSALLLTLSAWGAEVSNRAVLLILSTATPTWRIVLAELLVLGGASGLMGALAGSGFWLTTGAAQPGEVVAWSLAGALCGFTSAAIALLLVVVSAHPVVWFLFLVVGVDIISQTMPYWAIYVSVVGWARTVAAVAISPGGGGSVPMGEHALHAGVMLVLACVLCVTAVAASVRGLWRMRVKPDA